MWGQIDGKSKIEIARQTLSQVLKTLPKDLQLGLIAYGHREKGIVLISKKLLGPALVIHKLFPPQ